jgi:hypothetical protein
VDDSLMVWLIDKTPAYCVVKLQKRFCAAGDRRHAEACNRIKTNARQPISATIR